MAPPVLEWIDPTGIVTALHVEYDVRSVFAPPVTVTSEPVPGQPGERFREARHQIREFVLPLYLHDDPAALVTRLRALVWAMDPVRGEGRIRFTSEVGDTREIRCRAVAGLDLNQALGRDATPTHQRAAVVFRALDPYWYATSLTVAEFTTGQQPNFFPFFPLRLAASEVFADVTVDNRGDLATWPVWEIEGPGGPPIALRHLDTGEVTFLDDTVLITGQTITIDTRPGAKTVTREDGTNLYPNLSTASALWPLRPGANAVRIEMGGATEDSIVRLRYQPAHLTP